MSDDFSDIDPVLVEAIGANADAFIEADACVDEIIAWGAKVRIVGPEPNQVSMLPLEYFYVTPKTSEQKPVGPPPRPC